MPPDRFYASDTLSQVSDSTNDTVFYELGRFVDLCLKANPTCLEMLATPMDCVLFKSDHFSSISLDLFLSKQCYSSFAKYAESQLRKAKGMKRKILNPFPKERKDLLEFCFAYKDGKSVPLLDMLARYEIRQEDCGATKIPDMPGGYSLFWGDKSTQYRGLVEDVHTGEIVLSRIASDESPRALMFVNKDAYSTYCRRYKDYWSWVQLRNNARYEEATHEGCNYDKKNMMHTFRLLHTAKEIASTGKLQVRRTDRKFLLDIRNGRFTLEELLEMSGEILKTLPALFESSDLPAEPNRNEIIPIMVEIRKELYRKFLN